MISERLTAVILTQLGLDAWELREDTLASQVPGWDYLSHLGILCAVEQAYQIRFSTREALRLKNVGDLQALVDLRLQV
jgi:acyl carrier protein